MYVGFILTGNEKAQDPKSERSCASSSGRRRYVFYSGVFLPGRTPALPVMLPPEKSLSTFFSDFAGKGTAFI